MKFESAFTPGKLTLKGISTARRHFYFYTMLVLTTALGHNIWTLVKSPSAPPEIAEQVEELARTHQMAQTAIPR
jgi:hypothetical protein